MPGRHSGGSSLGGGSSGGGGFGGGGFRGGGGGFGGGGWGGGGWGGGWRPRGPWFRRPYYGGGGWFPFFGGGGWGWPMFFGPRFGGAGCGGCGGIGCLLFVCIIMFALFGGLGSFTRGFGPNYGSYNPDYGNGGSNGVSAPVSSNNQGAQLANESPAVQTQTAVDLTELHQALDSRITQWQQTLTADEFRTISGPDAGLTQDNNTKEVAYGKCGTALYVFVVANTRPDTGPADGEGYAYTTASSPGACHPPTWNVYDSEAVGGSWYFVTLKSVPGANQGR